MADVPATRDGKPFDQVVVDEAQDLAPSELQLFRRVGAPRRSFAVDELLSARIAGRKAISAPVIAERLVSAMAAEGKAILDEGVAATPSDIDLVEIHGYGFPRWKGGPMWMSKVIN